MKQAKTRIGIIGANFGTLVHLPALKLINQCEVVGISASCYERSKALSSEYNLPKAYQSWEEMISDKEIDAVSVAVPPFLQATIASAALEQGKAVFAEKPLTATIEQAEQLQYVAKSKSLPNMINFHLLSLDAWIRTKEILKAGGIGQLQCINIQYSGSTNSATSNTHWKFLKGRGTGALFDFSSHFFHALEWFAGPIIGISANLFSSMDDETSRDTFDVMATQFSSGAAASIIVNRTSVLSSGYKIELSGTDGTLILENKTRDIRGFNLFQATKDDNQLKLICTSLNAENNQYNDGRIYTTNKLMQGFFDWLEYGKPKTPNFDDGLRVQRLLDAAYTSDATRKWATL